MKKPPKLKEMQILWKDRKRTFLGLPWSFTKYKLTDEKLYIETGFFTSRQEETELFRIVDFTVTRTLGQKMFRLGTITMTTMEKNPTVVLKNIKYVYEVKELISDKVKENRKARGVTTRETFHTDGDDDDDND